MPRLELASELLEDFDRIFEHFAGHGVADIQPRIQEIIEALGILERHPLIGRPVEAERRELIIGKASRGYVALYHYLAALDTVFVLASRSQREAGYSHP
jgi:toxin ParE1/3/4